MNYKLIHYPALLLFWYDTTPTRPKLQRCQLGLLLRWRREGVIILW